MPTSVPEPKLKPQDQPRPRAKSATRVDGDETPRGRPQINRIHTDFGNNELHSMATGQRRAPSPYAYKPSASSTQLPANNTSKPGLLSPESAAAPRTNDSAPHRARSRHRERNDTALESSDSDLKTSRRDHRSKSRVRPKESSKDTLSSADERYRSGRSERHRSRHRSPHPAPDQSPPRQRYSGTNHKAAHGDITPPQTPSLPRESPYTSATDESDRRRRGKSRPRQPERRYSKESPYTSAAEDYYKRRSADERLDPKSRRGSVRRVDKPQLDSKDQRTSEHLDSLAPLSARTPKAMEDYLEKALQDNQKKHVKYTNANSAHASPFSSPPRSPPKTPRGERRTRDYFDMNPPTSTAYKQRSRPSSIDESSIKPFASLLSAALGGSLAAKVIPNISRSSTASLESPISGSQSSAPSGQRSRKPSPVYEDPRPISRTGSSTSKEDIQRQRMPPPPGDYGRPVSRAGSIASREDNIPFRHSTYPIQSDRPMSRAGSINDQQPARINTFPVFEDRPTSRNGSYVPSQNPQPPPTQRASSYSSPYDQTRPRPSQRRTYSSTNGAVVMPASSQHQHQPSSLSQAHTSPVAARSPSGPSAPAEKKSISFPICPMQYPVAGHNHWYTLQGVNNFNICTTCIRVLGGSSYRDHCVPSPYRPPSEAVACSVSRPWIRIAVAKSLQDGTADITVLDALNRLPPDVLPCPGKAIEVRKWYHITDPATKMPITNFNACTACVRSAEIIFPDLKKERLMMRPIDKLNQERVCSLNASSKHFYAIANEMDRLAGYAKKKDLRAKDISGFAEFLRKKMRYQECSKDAMLATPLWHFHPDLAEFTICEECFEEFVWPMKDKPIAKDMYKTLRRIPEYDAGGRQPTGRSCQLYSQKMRGILAWAVEKNDFEYLKQQALMRYQVEHQLHGEHRRLTQDLKAGLDRRADMERIATVWKTYE